MAGIQRLKLNEHSNQGVTLIEALITVFIVSIISASLYGMFLLGGRLVADSRLRTIGLYLANEEMENIKSMNYENIGTQGGVPDGDIPQLRTINKGSYDFEVKTEVKFLDDEADGTFPEDENPSDYKSVRLEISWPSSFEKRSVVLVTGVYPYSTGQEEGGGILSINAINFLGEGVASCDVDILNPDLNPPVEIHTGTDSFGNVILYGMPPSENGYEVKLSRSGYENVVTYPPYPESPFSPVDEDAIVTEGQLNTKSIRIDETGNFQIIIKDEKNNPLPGFSLAIKGGRIIGYTEELDPQAVYSFEEESLGASAEGIIEENDASPGQYQLSINNPAYELVEISSSNPFEMPAGGSSLLEIKCVQKTLDSLLIEVLDSENQEPISEASVTVTGLDYSANDTTDALGKAFFWQEGMQKGEYQVQVNAPDYQDYEDSVNLDELTQKQVLLTRN